VIENWGAILAGLLTIFEVSKNRIEGRNLESPSSAIYPGESGAKLEGDTLGSYFRK